MAIWVDADACPKPIKEILFRAATRTQIELNLIANQMLAVPKSPWIRSLQVPKGFDVADNEIVQRVAAGDLVITADIPLASEVIAKGAKVITPRGETYDAGSIAAALTMRNFMDTVSIYLLPSATNRLGRTLHIELRQNGISNLRDMSEEDAKLPAVAPEPTGHRTDDGGHALGAMAGGGAAASGLDAGQARRVARDRPALRVRPDDGVAALEAGHGKHLAKTQRNVTGHHQMCYRMTHLIDDPKWPRHPRKSCSNRNASN